MMAGNRMKQSTGCYDAFTHLAANNFPIRMFRYDKLHFANVSFGYVNTVRVVACCASPWDKRKDDRSFFAVATFDRFVIRRTGKYLRTKRSRK